MEAPSAGLLASGRKNPCPVCGRTKDGDCRIGPALVLCHYGITHHPGEGLRPGKVLEGRDGQRWAFTGDTADGRTAKFTLDKPLDGKPQGRVIPLRRAARAEAAPVEPAPIAGPIDLARLPEPSLLPPPSWQNGHQLTYAQGQVVVVRLSKAGAKQFHAHHGADMTLGAGPDLWPLWREADALEHGPGYWIAEAEGEKCAEWLRAGGLVAVSQPGHAHKPEQIQARYSRLLAAGITGVVFLADHDAQGERRLKEAQAAAAVVGMPFLPLPAATVWPDLPAGGSIDDAPGTAAERALAVATAATGRPPTLDDLLGPPKEGKLRRPRTDKLVPAVSLLLQLRYNLLANRIEHNGEPIHSDFLGGLYLELAEKHGLEVAKDRAIDAAMRVARQNAFHPVRDYLDGITVELSPEEWASIDVHCFGSEDPGGLSAVHLQRQLIGLVARAQDPGCELHTCLVLQSDEQGLGKSTFWKILGGLWFSDSLGDLRDLREDRLQLHSAWIHEWGEIDNVMGKRESETLKRFLSCSRDDVRRPYGRGTEQLLRSCGLVGTTNRRDFIKDPTGNRRFPIIRVRSVNLEWVRTNRDRIWGSAMAAYKAGQPWHYTAGEGLLISEQARAYAAEDPLRARLESWAEDYPLLDEVPLLRILWDLQHDCPSYWEQRANREFMRQASLALTSLGWRPVEEPRRRHFLPDGSKTDKVTAWKRPLEATAPALPQATAHQ